MVHSIYVYICVCLCSFNICKVKKRATAGKEQHEGHKQAEASDWFNCLVCAFDKVNRVHIVSSHERANASRVATHKL